MSAELAAPLAAMLAAFGFVLILFAFCVELFGEQRHVDPWPPGVLGEIRRSLDPPALLGRPPLLPQPTYPAYEGWATGTRHLAGDWQTGPIPVAAIGGTT